MRWLADHIIRMAVVLILVLCVVAFLDGAQHVRIEARTGSAEIEISPGQPIAWSMDGARLLECSQLAKMAADAKANATKKPQELLADGAEIVLAAIEETDGKRLSSVRAKVSLDGNDLVIELEPLIKSKGETASTSQECSKGESRVALLDPGDGRPRAISLPAQLRLDGERIRNGLTLEFRGGLRIGNDVTSSRQPLLMDGRLTLRQVRSHHLKNWADAQFEIESHQLGLGDKVTIAAPSLGEVSEYAPQGFVRIVREDKGTEIFLNVTTLAKLVEIVRPFGAIERPKALLIMRLWADKLLGSVVTFIIAFAGLFKNFFPTTTSAPQLATGPIWRRWPVRNKGDGPSAPKR